MPRRSAKRIGALISALFLLFLAQAVAVEPLPSSLPPLVLAVRVHLMQSDKNPDMHTTLTEDDIQRIFGKVNIIWSQAGIRFELESIRHTQALDMPPAIRPNIKHARFADAVPKDAINPTALNVFYVKTFGPNGFYYGTGIVVKDTAALKAVPGGLDEPIPRVTAHELGHALGLDHRQDGNNLMASGLNSFLLNEAEIKMARDKAQAIQVKPPTP